MGTVNDFVTDYEHADFQARIDRMYSSLGRQDPELWAQSLYLGLRDNPFHETYQTLNRDRWACLNLVYELVNAWEASDDPNRYEEEIANTFQTSRLKRLLYICLVMDRAQSLFKMRVPTSTEYGMHWYCNAHLEEGTAYAMEYPEEQRALRALQANGYQGFATMNRRIFKLLHTERFGLLNGEDIESVRLAEWSRPVFATFVELPITTPQEHVAAGGAPAPSVIPQETN